MLEFRPMGSPASKILMVRPSGFGYNPETAESNAFQKEPELDPEEIKRRGIDEFDSMVSRLRALDVDLVVIEEDDETVTPDAVFPNNWFSTHPDGTLVLYPMESKARRLERGVEDRVLKHFETKRRLDLTSFEDEGKYLEGTGSLVLDHENRVAYVCLSSRSDQSVLEKWAGELGFETCVFRSFDQAGKEIYHTNVMMCLGTGYAVACTESITNHDERTKFVAKIQETDRELIEITYEQMYSFAGNMLQITNKQGENLLLMSTGAHRSLLPEQIKRLEAYCRPVSFDIGTIEKCGGGSVRCMIAELF